MIKLSCSETSVNKYLIKRFYILGLMFAAFLVGGLSSLANTHVVANQNIGLNAKQAITIMDRQVSLLKGAQDSVVKTRTKKTTAFYTQDCSNKKHQSKGCERSCEQTCPPSTCITGILIRDTFDLRHYYFSNRLPFSTMLSDHIASTQPLFHPPKA